MRSYDTYNFHEKVTVTMSVSHSVGWVGLRSIYLPRNGEIDKPLIIHVHSVRDPRVIENLSASVANAANAP